jgi:selenocysteine lyase/cysteine desulfurase
MDRVHQHVREMTRRLLGILEDRCHADGRPAICIYGPTSTEARGGTVAFNVVDASGHVVPYGDVERAASEVGISLRGGCFCNPGAAERALAIPKEASMRCFESIPRGHFSLRDLAECLGPETAVGALRVSVGIPTTDADLDRLESFLSDFLERRSR